MRSPEAISFQLFVRDTLTRSGPNPNNPTVVIRSFEYQRDGQPAVRLIADLGASFWRQGDESSAGRQAPAVPCVPGESITARVLLDVNSIEYRLEGRSQCAVRSRNGLLLVHAFGS